MSLRERCQKLADNWDWTQEEVNTLEEFAREIRNEALEEAAKLADKISYSGHPDGWRTREQMVAYKLGEQIRALALAVAGNTKKV